jgi:hypothetical protein
VPFVPKEPTPAGKRALKRAERLDAQAKALAERRRVLLEGRAEALREAYAEGVVLRVIAEALGVTPERARQLLKKP